MTLKAILVEDEEASRETLAHYLNKYCPDVTLVAQADSVKTGIAAINKHKPDIVFLDVEMPYGNGFDLLDQIGEVNFATVFVTAYSHYAIKALNLCASYYILKPVDIDELINAVEKIKADKENNNHSFYSKILVENLQNASKQDHKIVLPQMDGFEVIQQIKANQNWRDIPIVVVTAKDLNDSDWEFLRQRVDKIIKKTGLDSETLVQEVQGLLREYLASRGEESVNEEDPGS